MYVMGVCVFNTGFLYVNPFVDMTHDGPWPSVVKIRPQRGFKWKQSNIELGNAIIMLSLISLNFQLHI